MNSNSLYTDIHDQGLLNEESLSITKSGTFLFLKRTRICPYDPS